MCAQTRSHACQCRPRTLWQFHGRLEHTTTSCDAGNRDASVAAGSWLRTKVHHRTSAPLLITRADHVFAPRALSFAVDDRPAPAQFRRGHARVPLPPRAVHREIRPAIRFERRTAIRPADMRQGAARPATNAARDICPPKHTVPRCDVSCTFRARAVSGLCFPSHTRSRRGRQSVHACAALAMHRRRRGRSMTHWVSRARGCTPHAAAQREESVPAEHVAQRRRGCRHRRAPPCTSRCAGCVAVCDQRNVPRVPAGQPRTADVSNARGGEPPPGGSLFINTRADRV